MTQTQGSFLLWPKNLQENAEKLEHDRKVCVLSVKLNKKILGFFVGFSALYKTIGHKDFLANLLTVLNDFWSVPWQMETTNAKQQKLILLPMLFAFFYAKKNGAN